MNYYYYYYYRFNSSQNKLAHTKMHFLLLLLV